MFFYPVSGVDAECLFEFSVECRIGHITSADEFFHLIYSITFYLYFHFERAISHVWQVTFGMEELFVGDTVSPSFNYIPALLAEELAYEVVQAVQECIAGIEQVKDVTEQ